MIEDNILPLFFAHSVTGKGVREWELLKDHLDCVADLAQRFATQFAGADFGYIAGLLHDIGKYSDAFQARLHGSKADAPHSIAGAKLAEEVYGDRTGRMIAYAIASHHGGLPNGIALVNNPTKRTSLQDRLNDTASKTCPNYSAYKREIEVLPPKPSLPKMQPYSGGDYRKAYNSLGVSLFIRMVFSCLLDADRLATETFYDSVEGRGLPAKRAAWLSFDDLKSKLDAFLSGKAASADKTDVNGKRAEILKAARDHAQEKPGIFTMTVPTGGGKTLSSLAFALDHAHHHQDAFRRVIYVIPFTSIIEQTAEVFREALGDDAILEHHSAFDDDAFLERLSAGSGKDYDADGTVKLRLVAENWDAPIVVTTAVQFFESLFASSAGKCRKLHNIARSVIVLDEAQTLPLPLLRPCIAALDQLARNYGCTIVLCTATQPALLSHENEPDRSFKGGFYNVRHIIKRPEQLYRDMRRVTVRHIVAQDDEALAGRLLANPQALCIVNTRAHARELYERLGKGDGNYHLSALMCPKHRAERLAEIRTRLAAKQPCRVVTTTLIEAGVDVDFPVVYRAEAGLDSIAQAAGRCNREGKRAPEASFLYVFKMADRKPHPGLKQYADIASQHLGDEADPLSPEAIEAYFREVYWKKGGGKKDELDSEGILDLLQTGCENQLWIPFETISNRFKIIADGQKPIIIPFDARARKLLADLANLDFGDRLGHIPRKLQPYIVTVHPQVFAEFHAAGAIQPVNKKRFGDQFHTLLGETPESLPSTYSTQVGLLTDEATFRSPLSNVFSD